MKQKGIAPLLIILSITVLLSIGTGIYLLGEKSFFSNPDSQSNEAISDQSLISANASIQPAINPSLAPASLESLPSMTPVPIPEGAITKKKISINCKTSGSDERDIIDYICHNDYLKYTDRIDPVYITTISLDNQTFKTFSVTYGEEVDWGGVRNTLNGYVINRSVFDRYNKESYAQLAKTNTFLSSPELLQALKNDGNFFLDQVLSILIKDEQDTPKETLTYIYYLKQDEFSRVTLQDCGYTYLVNDYIRNTDVPKEILEDLLNNSSHSPNPNSPENRNNFICDPNKTVKNILEMNLKSRH